MNIAVAGDNAWMGRALDNPYPELANIYLESSIQLIESSRRHAREQGKFITLKKRASRFFWLHEKQTQ